MASKYDNLIPFIIDDYDNGLSIQEINNKYGIKSHAFVGKVLGNKKRSASENSKLAILKRKTPYKHTDEIKEKLRQKRLDYMKAHPESTAWRKRNKPSYPEQCFINFLQQNGYDKKYLIEREYSFFPYFIDFAFVNEKLAIEIDGSQHLEKERKIADLKKENLLIKNGWNIIRFSESVVKTNWQLINEELLNKLNNTNNSSLTKVGILKHVALNRKKPRGDDGLTDKQREHAIKQRKVERPSKEELLNLITSKSFVEIGKMFGVCDKTITKWCKYYNLPSKRKEIKILHSYNR